MNNSGTKPFPRKIRKVGVYMKRYWVLYLMLLLPVMFFTIFRYIPMTYIQIAFKKYSIIQSVWDMPAALNHGFQYFIQAFHNRDFVRAIFNTLLLNILDLIVGFPAPIILALLLNELVFKKFKRITQTIVYLPHFLSWIIISGLALQLFTPESGLVNIFLKKIGLNAIPFLNEPKHWIATYILLGVWQSIGWNTIIYLSAITGINPELYEAAAVDGANRLKRMWHITLPGLRPTIVTLFILSLGRILGSEFDRPYSLSNPLVLKVSDVISTFVYTNGIKGLQFSLSAAAGLFQSLVCVIFLIAANSFAKKLGERGVF